MLFLIPVVVVLIADSYNNRTAIHPQGGPASNVHLLTHRPASRDDITRPPASRDDVTRPPASRDDVT